MKVDYDAALRRQGWNTRPKNKYVIPTSENPSFNAAFAIAVTAYPSSQHHVKGGKVEQYAKALMAYLYRISRLTGDLDRLPAWVADMRTESMERHLLTGLRNLIRAFTVRDLINSAMLMKHQHDLNKRKQKMTFTMQYTPDLKKLGVEIPFEETVSGCILLGKVPDTKLASLRAAILRHRPALTPFQGPAVKKDGRDPEGDYQNIYNRYVRPSLFTQHIAQLVWENACNFADEASELDIAVDQILMRKANWAKDIHQTTGKGIGTAMHVAKNLGVPCCWCEMIRFADPLSDS